MNFRKRTVAFLLALLMFSVSVTAFASTDAERKEWQENEWKRMESLTVEAIKGDVISCFMDAEDEMPTSLIKRIMETEAVLRVRYDGGRITIEKEDFRVPDPTVLNYTLEDLKRLYGTEQESVSDQPKGSSSASSAEPAPSGNATGNPNTGVMCQ